MSLQTHQGLTSGPSCLLFSLPAIFSHLLDGSCVLECSDFPVWLLCSLPVCFCSNVITARRPFPDFPSKIIPPCPPLSRSFAFASFPPHLADYILMGPFLSPPTRIWKLHARTLLFFSLPIFTPRNGA